MRSSIHGQTAIGLAAILAALFLALFAIPAWVSTPSNVSNIILSPLFWPYALAGLTGLVGLGLILTGRRAPRRPRPADAGAPARYVRLAAMAAIMAAYMYAMPRLGMVWSSMPAFAATAFLVRTSHPKTALAAAVAIPLLLYAFFVHVAGVAIPQGDYLRLP